MNPPCTLSASSFRSLLALALLAASGPAVVVHAQATPPSTSVAVTARPPQIQPLLATLTFPMDISHLKVGSKFQARVTQSWTYRTCTLQPNYLVEGHVSQIEKRSKASPRSAFDLVFDTAECDHHRGTPLRLTLIALIGPFGAAPPAGQSGVAQTQPLTDLPLSIGGGGGAASAGVPAGNGSSGFRSVESASSINFYSIGRSLPSQWKIGMVVYVPMHLEVGRGAEGGSTIWNTTQDARLEGQTTFILFPTADPTPKPVNPQAIP